MTEEELFFKENYPEYVTEKCECLSPYWDLFRAGVICATFELNKELGKVEGKLADLTSEYYELENLKNNEIAELKKKIENLQKYLDTQNCYRECAETWEKLTQAKEIICNLLRVTYGEGWNYSLQVKVEAEKFLKEE